jgi:flagellar biosynthesis protein FlhB
MERPTERRLRRAHREGDVPFSPLAVRGAALVAVVAALPSFGQAVRSRFHDRLSAALELRAMPSPLDVLADVAVLSAPILAVAAVVAIAIGLLQTRGATALAHRTRAGERPRRLASLLDGRRAARTAVAVAMLASVVVVTLRTLRRVLPDLAHALPSAKRALEVSEALLSTFAVPVVAILVTAAAVDYWLEHRFWLARLRMSPQQIKDERREQEGDPHVRRARRRAHEELARPAR